jgi:hypothetical protein
LPHSSLSGSSAVLRDNTAAFLSWRTRIFHALRSSRETELVDEFPLHVVTAWLGNTPKIADKQYNQVTESHFARAVGTSLLAS